MHKLAILWGTVGLGVILAALIDGAPVTSNHQLTDSATISSGDLSSGIMDLESPNDGEFELDGTIKNNTTGIKRIRDVKIWFEKNDGTKLKTSNGNGPVSGLSTNSGGTPNNAATLVSRANGVSTFNLADTPSRGAAVNYGCQVDHFVEPNKYKIKMSFSQKKEPTSKHFEFVGFRGFTDSKAEYTFDGIAPTTREGVLISMKNADGGNTITGGYVEVVSGHPDLEFKSGVVWDKDDNPIQGATMTVSNSGKRITISGLSLSNPQIANLWLDLNNSYTETTSFKVHATFLE